MTPHHFNVDSVAIIGAGPSGVAAAKYLVSEQAFAKIDVFEQRASVGGVWDYHNDSKELLEPLTPPLLSPHTGLAKPVWHQSGTKQALGPGVEEDMRFLSPLYDRLETNIPRTLMGFSDQEWPEDAQLFPKHETVTEYLEKHAEEVKHLIQFRTQVLNVTPVKAEGSSQERWLVETQEVKSGEPAASTKNVYDAVVVASGHFSVPYIPNVKGMREWSGKYPGVLTHSMFYKWPEDYAGKKVIVVGNGPSGLDIAAQIMSVDCKKPVLQSTKSESYLLSDVSSDKLEKPEIVEYILDDRAVRFADGSVEKDIDVILYSTGYFYSFPFLRDIDPPLIEDGTHVRNLYLHMIYRQHPTMVFPVCQQRVIPFPMSEVQASVFARLWSGRLSLPSEEEMKLWEDKTYGETGGGRDFHLLSFPKDANYINMMHDWAMSAPDAEIKGKKPPRWGDKECWLREQFPAIKKAFQDRGESRHQVQTVEQLGFDFDEYVRKKAIESKSLL
ncbi:hypothetical protein AAFC00_003636 [Neodothiora populina]|uniref:Flavin dependent monooxygenase n=1 Tax=Neodothiora populina TaxID=2781224 RepID=A0ABR3PEV7_9PEZI